MKTPPTDDRAARAYVRACVALARLGWRYRRARATDGRANPSSELTIALDLSHLSIDSDTVLRAASTATLMAFAALIIVSVMSVLVSGLEDSLILVLMAVMVPLLLGELIKSYPRVLSRRLSSEVIKDSTGAISLMVMSLRREPSLSRAIFFSCARKDRFSAELRKCTWGVVMGEFESFEDALQALGERWSGLGSELKTAMNALITASCEATEDGLRRALDRANSASIQGVKRRIEEYALSLSTPSMVMFGLAILLPLMVGSFLPMLSWDAWTSSSGAMGPDIGTNPIGPSEVAFIMNVVFPSLGLVVAMGSVQRHPLEPRANVTAPKANVILSFGAPTILITAVLIVSAALWLDGVCQAVAILASSTVPVSALLLYLGTTGSELSSKERGALEEALFRMGARMVEGENFESALCEACKGEDGALKARVQGGILMSSQDALGRGRGGNSSRGADEQALEAFSVVREAASKDERAAGLLAMDLATYIRDMRETERSLRSRLKPTISMMKITSFVLAPVVLGVTFAMYMTLGAIAGEGSGTLDPGMFLMVLGAFLAESNAVVQYFIWGIEGKRAKSHLAASVGACILVSELLFIATALIAS